MAMVSELLPSTQFPWHKLTGVQKLDDTFYLADCPLCEQHSLAIRDQEDETSVKCAGNCSEKDLWGFLDERTIPEIKPPKVLEGTKPFPAHTIPEPLLNLATEVGRSGGYPKEFLIVPGLSALAGAIGGTYAVQFDSTRIERPILWTAVVAKPGAGKSPALDTVMYPFHEFDRRERMEFQNEYQGWDPKSGEPEPILRRSIISNITLEAQIELMAHNPRGMLRVVDEVAEVIGALNQYKGGRGADRQQLLTLWSGGTVYRDRIKQKAPVVVDDPTCSIAGGMQPSKVTSFLSGDDGMSQRWLLAYYPNTKTSFGEDANPVIIELWNSLIYKLLRLEFHGLPTICTLSPEAKKVWIAYRRRNEDHTNRATNDVMSSYWAKLSRHTGRLITTLHVSEAVAQESIPPKQVSAETTQNGIEIADWFAEQYLANLPAEENWMLPRHLRDQDVAVAKLLEYVRASDHPVNRREIQTYKVGGARSPQEVDGLIERFKAIYPELVVAGNKFYSGDQS